MRRPCSLPRSESEVACLTQKSDENWGERGGGFPQDGAVFIKRAKHAHRLSRTDDYDTSVEEQHMSACGGRMEGGLKMPGTRRLDNPASPSTRLPALCGGVILPESTLLRRTDKLVRCYIG